MLKKIALVFVVAIVALLGYASTRPDTFRVERSQLIQAPAEKIFPLINDLHAWTVWSPFEKLDPAMKRTFGAVTVGKGATYGWEGNSAAGAGSMEILESVPPSKVAIQLHFTRPMDDTSTAEFTLDGRSDGTLVTWSMYGPASLISKVMGIFCNMDKMIGGSFEEGLTSLKGKAEAP